MTFCMKYLPLKLNQLPLVRSDFHEVLHGVSAPKIESTAPDLNLVYVHMVGDSCKF